LIYIHCIGLSLMRGGALQGFLYLLLNAVCMVSAHLLKSFRVLFYSCHS
jgi:hypothetical protein